MSQSPSVSREHAPPNQIDVLPSPTFLSNCNVKRIMGVAFAAILLLVGVLALSGVNGLAEMGHAGGGTLVGFSALLLLILCRNNYVSMRDQKALIELREKTVSAIVKGFIAMSLENAPTKEIEIVLYVRDQPFAIKVMKDDALEEVRSKVVKLCAEHLHRKEGWYSVHPSNVRAVSASTI